MSGPPRRPHNSSSTTGLLVTLAAASALVVAMVLASVLTGRGSGFDVFALATVVIGWTVVAVYTHGRRA